MQGLERKLTFDLPPSFPSTASFSFITPGTWVYKKSSIQKLFQFSGFFLLNLQRFQFDRSKSWGLRARPILLRAWGVH